MADDEISTGGRYVELGAAILSRKEFGKPLIYVVDNTSGSMFYFHPLVEQRENIHQVLEEVEKA